MLTMNRELEALNKLRASHAKTSERETTTSVDLDNLAKALKKFDGKSFK